MTNVLDASALLAFLHDEPGTAQVEELLTSGAHCSSVNWSEVAQKVRSSEGDWRLTRSVFESYGLKIVPATVEDAEQAALLWRRGSGLSIADRFCLALATRLRGVVWTADRVWGTSDNVRQIR